jgi:hypothetical protein
VLHRTYAREAKSGFVAAAGRSEMQHLTSRDTGSSQLESKNQSGTETKVVLSALMEVGG